MDYQKHINEIRDILHKDLVQEACHKNYILNDSSDGVLQIHDPIYLKIEDELLVLVSIDCDSGLPVVETHIGRFRPIKYSNLTVEELIQLHRIVVQAKQYTFTPEKELV